MRLLNSIQSAVHLHFLLVFVKCVVITFEMNVHEVTPQTKNNKTISLFFFISSKASKANRVDFKFGKIRKRVYTHTNVNLMK